jgi:hypothetical protein
MITLTRAAVLCAAVLTTVGCGGSKPESATPTPESLPLSGIVGQNIVVAPVQALRIPPDVGWPALPASRVALAKLDSVITDTLRVRVANAGWVYADGVVKSAVNNPTYATDPRALAVNPLRSAAVKVGDRLPEPVASQLRTMIAFHDVRLVMIPLDLTIEPVSPGGGRPVLHLMLVDPRSSVVRWIGKVTGADSPAFTPEISANLAARFADLFVPK